jgi:hypothetical protein
MDVRGIGWGDIDSIDLAQEPFCEHCNELSDSIKCYVVLE